MPEQESSRRTVLFLCTENSVRSQMAEAFLRSRFPDRYEAFSAGLEPTVVHPLAIRVMAELSIDMANHRSKALEEYTGKDFDVVVTVCDHARETCPFFPGGTLREHQGFPDPASADGSEEDRLRLFRNVRDEIKEWVMKRFSHRA